MPKEENDIKIAVVVVTAIIVILVLFIGALLILSYAVRNRSLRKQRDILEKQSMLAQLETREQLLKNVSQELHDNIGQVASLLKIGIETLLQDPAYSNNPRLGKLLELNRKLIKDVRSISLTIHADKSLNKGLEQALRKQIELVSQLGNIQAKFETNASFPPLTLEKSSIIYRICQEALNNVLKHSEAKQLTLFSTVSENILILEIVDNGIGFPENKTGNGSGLVNMKERAKLLGGTVVTHSEPTKGTSVEITIPLSPPANGNLGKT